MEFFLCKRWPNYQNNLLKQVGITRTYLNLQTNGNSQTDLFTQTSAKRPGMLIQLTLNLKYFPKGRRKMKYPYWRATSTFFATNTVKMHTSSKQVFSGLYVVVLTFQEKLKIQSRLPSSRETRGKKWVHYSGKVRICQSYKCEESIL